MQIVATALVSSVGYDADTACASARAGLTRAAELPFTLLESDGSPALAIGHPAPLLAHGFEGDSRLVRLLQGAFRDLLLRTSPDTLAAMRLGIYLAMPASDREHHGLELILDDAARQRHSQTLKAPTDDTARGRRLLARAMAMAKLPSAAIRAVDTAHVSTSGHAAVVELYAHAQRDLARGSIDAALVAAVDSLVGSSTLKWLRLTNRLKGGESPDGLSPGEAAAVIVLVGDDSRTALGFPLASIGEIALSSTSAQFLAGAPPDGQGLFDVMAGLTAALGGFTGTEWTIVDQNGETFRAADWGCCQVRLGAPRSTDQAGATVWFPAGSFGDVGAVSGAISTCLAVRAHARGYSAAPHAFVLTSSDGPARAGCIVSAMEN